MFPRAAITKYQRLGYLTEIYLLTVVEIRSPKSRSWQGWFLLRAVSLTCKWLHSSFLRDFFLCISDVSSSSYEDTNCIGLACCMQVYSVAKLCLTLWTLKPCGFYFARLLCPRNFQARILG